jgi:hypothetical protein
VLRLSCAGVVAALMGACASDVLPQEGAWTYFPGALVDDECMLGADTSLDPYGAFIVSEVTAETFIINTGDAEPFSCRLLGGGAFECPERLESSAPVEGFDATITANVRVDGTFISEVEAEGTQTATFACEGADCGDPLIAFAIMLAYPNTTLPCSYTVEFTATVK